MCAKRVGAFLFLVLLCVCAGMLVLINLPRVATTPTPAPAIVRVTHTAAPMASAVPPPPPAASLAPSRPTCGQPITFPRPPGDNGRGVHWCPATRHSKAATDRLVSEVVSMGLKWVVLVEGIDSWDFDHALREEDAYLIWHLQSQGIMPIVRLKSEVGASDEKAFLDKARELRELGIHYFQIFNEPNRDDEWAVVGPRTPEAYMFHWLRRAKAIVALFSAGYRDWDRWIQPQTPAARATIWSSCAAPWRSSGRATSAMSLLAPGSACITTSSLTSATATTT